MTEFKKLDILEILNLTEFLIIFFALAKFLKLLNIAKFMIF